MTSDTGLSIKICASGSLSGNTMTSDSDKITSPMSTSLFIGIGSSNTGENSFSQINQHFVTGLNIYRNIAMFKKEVGFAANKGEVTWPEQTTLG